MDYEEVSRKYESIKQEIILLEPWFSSVGPGWRPVLEALNGAFKHLVAERRATDYPEAKVHINQVKEKFGGLRVYFSAGGMKEGDFDRLSNYVEMAERTCQKLCEECGESEGVETRSPEKSGGYGWVLTLCPKHHKERDETGRIERF